LEHLIALFSRYLSDDEIRYEIMEKHSYALVKSLKSFRVYVLHSKIISYVPSSTVREILIQHDINGNRSKSIVDILEFDLEINPTKLVKGKGLARFLVESNCKALGVNFMGTNSDN
jgi:predicted MarR family transcription regulator